VVATPRARGSAPVAAVVYVPEVKCFRVSQVLFFFFLGTGGSERVVSHIKCFPGKSGPILAVVVAVLKI
jgi:hypothetical protein